MRDWKIPIKPGDRLTLSADTRFSPTDICDDQIWDICWQDSDMHAFTIQTTYGLRVQKVRFFPQFVHREKRVSDPAVFHQPLLLHKFTPNYALFSCMPFAGIETRLEYWVPESHAISGRISFTNRTTESQLIFLEWAGMMNSQGYGQNLVHYPLGPGHVLTGHAENLNPVCYLTGSPQPARTTLPALSVPVELEPGQTRRLTWVVAGLQTLEKSFELARSLTARQWDAEITAIEMQNTRQIIEITTGDAIWDLAFALSQKEAFRLQMNTCGDNPLPALVHNRNPDQGFSVRGDGKDLPGSWSNITPLDLAYWLQIILPGAPEIASQTIKGVLEAVSPEGFLDLNRGAGGLRSRRMAQPMLVYLSWLIEQADASKTLRREHFQALLDNLVKWFSADYDRDQDGFPEWDHPEQTGVPASPAFSRSFAHNQDYSIHFLESPSLAAMLHRECSLLLETAQERNDPETAGWLQDKIESIEKGFDRFYSQKNGSLRYVDFQTHLSPSGKRIGTINGNGTINPAIELPEPGRPVVIVRLGEQQNVPLQVLIKGRSANNRLANETLSAENFTWHQNKGLAISSKVFKQINTVQVKGIKENDRVEITTVDHNVEDISLFLPLWTELLSQEQADNLIDNYFYPRYYREFGNPATTPNHLLPDSNPDTTSQLTWTVLLGQGLFAYRHGLKAAEILTRIMHAIVLQINKNLQFSEFYDTETGLGTGKVNSLTGLAPVGFFLQVVGIKSLGDSQIVLSGTNPFPWPVTVKYKGRTITRNQEDSEIVFLSGERISVKGPGPHRISLR